MKNAAPFRHSTLRLFLPLFLLVLNLSVVRADLTIQIGPTYGLSQAPQSTIGCNFVTPYPGEFTIHVSGWLTTYDWGLDYDRVYVYNDEGLPVSRSGFSTQEDPFLFHMFQGTTGLTFRLGKAGAYTIKMHSGAIRVSDWGTATSQNYTLSVSATYCSDKFETNETKISATPILLDSTITAYQWRQINTSDISGDEDWYKIYVPSPGKLRIDLSHWIGVYDWGNDFDRLYVYNADGTSIGGSDYYSWMMGGGTDSVPVVIQMNLTHSGTYYWRFHAGAGVSLEPYHFKTSFIQAYDPFEPNDSIPDAKPILMSDVWYQACEWRTADYSMNVNGDEDFYRFDAPSEGTYSLQLTGWIGIFNWGADYDWVRILNARGVVVGANPLSWMMGTSAINFTVPSVGRYYIQLHCGATSSLSGYQFKLTGNIVVRLAENASTEQFLISPNPARDLLNLNLPTMDGVGRVSIFALDGSLLKTEIVSRASHQMDVSNLNPGMYLLEYLCNGRSIRQKLMVRR